jgi:hypothetical protein
LKRLLVEFDCLRDLASVDVCIRKIVHC